MANQCTKFEISHYGHFADILGGLKIKMGHVTITTLLLECFYICLIRLDITYMCTKSDSSSLNHFLDIDGGPKLKKSHMT